MYTTEYYRITLQLKLPGLPSATLSSPQKQFLSLLKTMEYSGTASDPSEVAVSLIVLNCMFIDISNVFYSMLWKVTVIRNV